MTFFSPYLRVWYWHTLWLHRGLASHTWGDVVVTSSWAWWQVSASFLQRQLPTGQMRSRWSSARSPSLLWPTMSHTVGRTPVWVFYRHGSQGVHDGTALTGRLRVQPLRTRVRACGHGQRSGGSGACAGAGVGMKNAGGWQPASTGSEPKCGLNGQALSKAETGEKEQRD